HRHGSVPRTTGRHPRVGSRSMKRLSIVLAACGGHAATAPVPAPQSPPAVPTAPSVSVETIRPGTIAVGERHACAVLVTGHVACWGSASEGALGTPGNDDQPKPVEVPGLAEVAGIAAARSLTCAWT